MALENNWVSYIERNYQKIKTSVINRARNVLPEVTDWSDSNILVIIISILAGLMEQLHYYVDNMAREAFITTARRYTSVVKLSRSVDYRIRGKIGAVSELLVTALDSGGDPYNIDASLTIPTGTAFTTSDGIIYTSVKDAIIQAGTSSTYIQVRQWERVTGENLGTTNGGVNQLIELPSNFHDGTSEITIGTTPYLFKETMGFSFATDKHYTTISSIDQVMFIQLGDDITGAIPPAGQTITMDYYSTRGAQGRVSAEAINAFVSDPSLAGTGAASLTVVNPEPSVGGLNVEDIESIRKRVPLSLRTLDRAVTPQDFVDLALLVNNVNRVGVLYECGQVLEIFVAPVGGGTAPNVLLSDVEAYFEDKKIEPAEIVARPAGETVVLVDMSVTAKFRESALETKDDVIDALVTEYSASNSNINNKIHISDIVALVDNLARVDYLTINSITTIPYPRPSTSTAVNLAWVVEVLQGSTEIISWEVRYNGGVSDQFTLFKNGDFLRNFDIDEEVSETQVKFTVASGSYSTNNRWAFKTYPYNKDIFTEDNTIPVITENSITISVTEQTS